MPQFYGGGVQILPFSPTSLRLQIFLENFCTKCIPGGVQSKYLQVFCDSHTQYLNVFLLDSVKKTCNSLTPTDKWIQEGVLPFQLLNKKLHLFYSKNFKDRWSNEIQQQNEYYDDMSPHTIINKGNLKWLNKCRDWNKKNRNLWSTNKANSIVGIWLLDSTQSNIIL